MSARPRSLVLVGGTGTEVGKTWVAAAVAGQLREEGWVISARKPAQSFDPHDDAPHDSEVLGEATNESPDAVCPPHRNYEVAMAPPMAATSLGRPSFTTSDLVDEVTGSWPPHSVDVGIVELAGGWRSPQAAPDAAGDDCRAFASLLAPDLVVLVADAGLGTLNSVRSALDSVDQPAVVVLNRFDPLDPLHGANRDWLVEVDGTEVFTSSGALVGLIASGLGGYCTGCGRRAPECSGCLPELEAPRRCQRCGRRLTVVVTPTSVHASCRLHGDGTVRRSGRSPR